MGNHKSCSLKMLANFPGIDNVVTQNLSLKPIAEALKDKKLIGVYFSAHWCPPCRKFTPLLAKFYTQLKERDPHALEVVFVSSDNDQQSMMEYFEASMPWTAAEFTPGIDQCKAYHTVSGIPNFKLISPKDGKVVDGREVNNIILNSNDSVVEAFEELL